MNTSNASLYIEVELPLDRFELAVTLTVDNAVTGVFGVSGSGKTSLLETVAGLRRQARGVVRASDDVWLDSAAGVFVPPERRDIGYVPQDGLLFPHLTVRQNLLAGARRARARGQDPEKVLRHVAELLEIDALLDRTAPTLSGGERQRVALGRALVSGPRLLLLDEPFAALDLPLRRKLLPLLRRVREELTVPMLLVSHDPIEVQALCDDLVVLRDGREIARGAPRQVLTDPAVFALAEQEGFENVLPGRLLENDEATCRVRLGTGGPDLVALHGGVAAGDVLAGIAANEILIATERPRGLSAQNVVPARLVELRALERLVLLTAELASDVPTLTVELAETTPAKLGLEPGSEIFLVVKAAAIRLYGQRSC